ncbi:hypothetical protein CDL12_26875 [Handroanthus impetiginosus]|uniref:Uncharacterized protein n=1 Tax=Handroanthus impetiginosus TaxID=429701 RepID=A0A2G9G5P6_9LAMI|nr:hypothetical protein CDL12_26875 [Handroanthus impetiginosus]
MGCKPIETSQLKKCSSLAQLKPCSFRFLAKQFLYVGLARVFLDLHVISSWAESITKLSLFSFSMILLVVTSGSLSTTRTNGYWNCRKVALSKNCRHLYRLRGYV